MPIVPKAEALKEYNKIMEERDQKAEQMIDSINKAIMSAARCGQKFCQFHVASHLQPFVIKRLEAEKYFVKQIEGNNNLIINWVDEDNDAES